MADKSNNGRKPSARASAGINRIVVGGYKSLRKEQSIEVRPLTILAGANSSGKSSIMQPLLLLKQTLEAPFDPGALLLNGPHLKFTYANQLLSHGAKEFHVGIRADRHRMVVPYFIARAGKGFDIKEMRIVGTDGNKTVSPETASNEVLAILGIKEDLFPQGEWLIERVRCFFEMKLTGSRDNDGQASEDDSLAQKVARALRESLSISVTNDIEESLQRIIHVPGLRGNPEREYPLTAVGDTFPGTFDNYVASVIEQWQTSNNDDEVEQLNNDLKMLGLTSTAIAERINDTQVRIQVGRLTTNGKTRDLVNITDVGFGVSQALPVLVALLTAQPGQLVYIEQPEIHLHPYAQSKMAEALAKAARRGVKVVVETHSSLLLLGIQTLVAKGELNPDDVILHWFTRSPRSGNTKVSTATLDEAGTFGEWPEDFADTELDAQAEYLNASELRHQAR